MGKREAIAVLVLVTGVLLFNSMVTVPLGVLLIGGGAYLLLLPYIETYQRAVSRSHGGRGRM